MADTAVGGADLADQGTEARPPGGRGVRARLSGRLPEAGPQRILTFAILVNTMGGGLVMTSIVLFFTRVVHLSATRVGLGMTLAGLLGIVAGVPVGSLADRRGPREVQIVLLCIAGLTTVGYVFIHGFVLFVVVVALDMLMDNASAAVRGGLIRRIGGEGAAAFRAKLRATSNLGTSIGTLLAAAAIQADTRLVYELLILGNAATFFTCALLLCRLPHLKPLPQPEKASPWSSLRDIPHNAWAIVNGLMMMQDQVLLIPLPLWIVSHSHAPRWSVAFYMLINTVMCVLLQVRVGSKVSTIREGARAYRTAGLFFLVSCPMLGLLAHVPGWAALLLLAAGCVVHTVGELWHASGEFALGFALAPAHAQSQYQGLQSMWTGLLGFSAAPAVLTLVCLDGGTAGWCALGGFFALLGLVAIPATHWAERTRGAHGVAVGAEA